MPAGSLISRGFGRRRALDRQLARTVGGMMTLANHEMPSRTSLAFDAITLRSPDGSTEAEFVPTANMLCCSIKHHGLEFVHRGAGVDAYAERGITMGIPLLHPRANRVAAFEYEAAGKHVRLQRGASPIPTDEAGLPIHGVLAALMRWEVEEREPDALSYSHSSISCASRSRSVTQS
jgi:hypothetical protein